MAEVCVRISCSKLGRQGQWGLGVEQAASVVGSTP